MGWHGSCGGMSPGIGLSLVQCSWCGQIQGSDVWKWVDPHGGDAPGGLVWLWSQGEAVVLEESEVQMFETWGSGWSWGIAIWLLEVGWCWYLRFLEANPQLPAA
jgi:hypothetical protein